MIEPSKVDPFLIIIHPSFLNKFQSVTKVQHIIKSFLSKYVDLHITNYCDVSNWI